MDKQPKTIAKNMKQENEEIGSKLQLEALQRGGSSRDGTDENAVSNILSPPCQEESKDDDNLSKDGKSDLNNTQPLSLRKSRQSALID